MSKSRLLKLLGFDEQAHVYRFNGTILRGILSNEKNFYEKLIKTCEKFDFLKKSIIETHIINNHPLAKKNYPLVLEHKKIDYISYPYEWAGEMLKDAALLQINLHLELLRHGLILKDSHPWNFLFQFTNPFLVDFTSITTSEKLQEEKFIRELTVPYFFKNLYSDDQLNFYKNYHSMFSPYFLLPLYLMSQNKFKLARRRLLETTINSKHGVMTSTEVFGKFTTSRFIFESLELIKNISLLPKTGGIKNYLLILRKQINGLQLISESNYTSYYKGKKEDFDFKNPSSWGAKQTIVDKLLTEAKPRDVLDIGANTGWFSIIAAKKGSNVISCDTDEAAMNLLYNDAKQLKLNILPLVLDINEKITEQRFRCEFVLVLALIHHLVLGQDQTFSKVIKKLDQLSRKYLAVEFIPADDELIVSEPSFFPAYSRNPQKFAWYSLKNLKKELSKYFQKVEVFNSHPRKRKILFCVK